MVDQALTDKMLSVDQPMSENPTRFSTISLLLKGARSLSGRNLQTGVYELREFNETNFINGTYHSFQFTGLIDYLILLEQVGSIFKPINKSTIDKNPIPRALGYFTLLESKKIESVVGLRNSIAHKFGLATESSPRNGSRKFALSNNRNVAVIDLPQTPWNGDFSDKSDATTTIVYLHDLIDLIESVYQSIISENKCGNIEMTLEGGIAELYARYTMIY